LRSHHWVLSAGNGDDKENESRSEDDLPPASRPNKKIRLEKESEMETEIPTAQLGNVIS